MKKILSISILSGFLFLSCSLEEEPILLSNEVIYNNPENAVAALNGIYQGLAGYEMYGNVYYFLNGLYSGMILSKRSMTNNEIYTPYNGTLGTFSVPSGELNTGRVWERLYVTIGRSNDAIFLGETVENPQSEDDFVINDVIGQAHFVRAFSYYMLVSIWGEVPLRTAPTSLETIHLGTSTKKEIYNQMLSDLDKAISLMNGTAGEDFPKVYAANMLLAKVYMNLATAPADVQDGVTNYWQAAYDEAIKVYGQYQLESDYARLFSEGNDGTSESIFELQYSSTASHDWVRAFTPNNYIVANSFGWLQVSADFYELHANTYPGDQRIATTYLSSWVQTNNGSTTNKYPNNSSRTTFNNAHPFLYKLGEKDQTKAYQVSEQNAIIFRYADLLLMLAEISNELQNGEQLDYVTEVLDRVGLFPQAQYYGTQDDFRTAIMREYQFELLAEGFDCITVRRRGYDWFKTNIIDFHNNNPLFDPNVDIQHAEGEDVVMHLPIPDAELNTNQNIN